MAKYIELSADSPDKLCLVAKALSSPLRIDIIKLLYEQSCNVREIAEKLSIPASSRFTCEGIGGSRIDHYRAAAGRKRKCEGVQPKG